MTAASISSRSERRGRGRGLLVRLQQLPVTLPESSRNGRVSAVDTEEVSLIDDIESCEKVGDRPAHEPLLLLSLAEVPINSSSSSTGGHNGPQSRSKWFKSARGLSDQASTKRAPATDTTRRLEVLVPRLLVAGAADCDRRGIAVSASRADTAGGRVYRGGRLRRGMLLGHVEKAMSTGRDRGIIGVVMD